MSSLTEKLIAGIPAKYLPTIEQLRAMDSNKRGKLVAGAVLVTKSEAGDRQEALDKIAKHLLVLPSIEKKEEFISEVSRLQRAHAKKDLLRGHMSKRLFKIFLIILTNRSAEGHDYCKLLRDANISTPPKWKGCPGSYVKAYAIPYWAQRINQEKSQIVKMGSVILDD